MPIYRVTIDTSRLVDTHEPGDSWQDSVRRCVERLTKGHDVTIESIERTP